MQDPVEIQFDSKYFTKKGLKAVCNTNKVYFYNADPWLPLSNLYSDKELRELKKQHFLSFNSKSVDDIRSYWERMLSLHCMKNKLVVDNLFKSPFNYKWFTVDGLKQLCDVNKVDTCDCVTRKDFQKNLSAHCQIFA